MRRSRAACAEAATPRAARGAPRPRRPAVLELARHLEFCSTSLIRRSTGIGRSMVGAMPVETAGVGAAVDLQWAARCPKEPLGLERGHLPLVRRSCREIRRFRPGFLLLSTVARPGQPVSEQFHLAPGGRVRRLRTIDAAVTQRKTVRAMSSAGQRHELVWSAKSRARVTKRSVGASDCGDFGETNSQRSRACAGHPPV